MNGELIQITSGKKKVPETTPRLVATLAVAGLLSGLAIVSAYELTRPTIAANKARVIRRDRATSETPWQPPRLTP